MEKMKRIILVHVPEIEVVDDLIERLEWCKVKNQNKEDFGESDVIDLVIHGNNAILVTLTRENGNGDGTFIAKLEGTHIGENHVCDYESETADEISDDLCDAINDLMPTMSIIWSVDEDRKSFGDELIKRSWLPKEILLTMKAIGRMRFPDEYTKDPVEEVQAIMDDLSVHANAIVLKHDSVTNKITVEPVVYSSESDMVTHIAHNAEMLSGFLDTLELRMNTYAESHVEATSTS